MKSLVKIRTQLKKLKNSNSFFGKVLFKIIYFFWATFKFIITPRYRSEQISRIRYSKQIIQVSTYTKENRYPLLFKQIAEELKIIENPKILSFGCSTGEEVFSLKQLLPEAEITGVDINHWCIKTARNNNPFSDCQFIHVSDMNWRIDDYYDCILALAIFQKTIHRHPDIKKTTDSFGFMSFEKEVTVLSNFHKMNGLFILDHSDYRFTDLEIFSRNYNQELGTLSVRPRPSYNKLNIKTSNSSVSYRIFKKCN